jgi:Cysteine-rich CPCC
MPILPNQKGLYPCPCCDYFTLPRQVPNSFEICPVCFWEDDGLQLLDPHFADGANSISLHQAKANYARWGAITQEVVSFVRPARAYERNA